MIEQTIDIKNVARIFGLLQKVNNSGSVYVSELAKEMNVKKTALMAFILDNPRLFKSSSDKKGATLRKVYLSPAENPYDKAFLENIKATWSKWLYVLQWDCYGKKEEYYLPDESGTRDNYKYDYSYPYDRQVWLWRNTREKMEKVKESGHFHKGTGSTGMWSGTSIPYCVSIEEMKALIDDGWHLEGELPKEVRFYKVEEE